MKFLALAFLFLIPQAQAKFAAFVMQIPCHKMQVKIASCQAKKIKNTDLKPDTKNLISYQGALVSAQILSDAATKCSAEQKMDTKRFRAFKNEKRNFFVIQGSCQKLKTDTKTSFQNQNYFCDTPGAMGINECFLNTLSRKNRWLIVKEVK